MKILILPIGKIRSKPVAEIAADYAERLGHYTGLHVLPCRDERELLSNVKAGDHLILLDAGGGGGPFQEKPHRDDLHVGHDVLLTESDERIDG